MTVYPASQIVQTTRSNDAYAWGGHYQVNRGYSADGLNRYTASGSVTPTYDANGNLTSAGGAAYYVYDSTNRLYAMDNGVLGYDPAGRLFAIGTLAGHTYLLNSGDEMIGEYSSTGAVLRRYVHGPGIDEPLVWYEGSGTSDRRWLHADERGSVIALSNGSGDVTSVNAYDEYGIPASGNTGRFQYTGQQWLSELGMQYSRNRIYSPTLGRFMQTDPIGFWGGMNLYGYVLNDPVNLVDPWGLDDKKVVVIGPPAWWRRLQAMLASLNRMEIRQLQQRVTQEQVAAGARESAGLASEMDPCGGRLTANPTATSQPAIPAPGTGQGAPGFGSRPGGHYGIDFANPVGGPVYAAGAGRMARADGGDAGGFGNQVVINHGGRVYTQYGHLGTMGVRVGGNVNAGQTIGTTAQPGGSGSGNLGRGMSPHVHFEVRIGSALAQSRGGNPINPNSCLPGSR